MTIRLATYNIHKFVGRDGKRDEERILGVIGAMNADILALQEFVLQDHGGDISIVEAFAVKAGYHFIAQPMLRANSMVQFNLLLSRAPVRSQNLVTLPRDGHEPRGVIAAEYEIGGRRLYVAATHLGLSPTARIRQLAMIVELCAGQTQAPFALLGDLNIMVPWEPAQRYLRKAFPGQKQPASFPSRLPLLAVDSIFFRPAEMIQSLRIFSESGAREASDHLPLIADIALS
ncbi:MAG: endonuclease/exonuclease/phosphatase family protein [Micropepsaceae bacterium]